MPPRVRRGRGQALEFPDRGHRDQKLRGGSGIQWLCHEAAPEGAERLDADSKFWSTPEYCESYGKDLITGAPLEPTEYRALNPFGRAVIKAAEYLPAHERPDARRPFALITGRVPQWQAAAVRPTVGADAIVRGVVQALRGGAR